MESQDALLVEKARRFVSAKNDDDGIQEYRDDVLTVICRGQAVTVYLKSHEDPVLLVTSRGTLVHVENSTRKYLADRFA